MRRLILLAAMLLSASPVPAFAWGFEGHRVIALMARNYLTPRVRERVDQILASDTDPLTGHDMADEATWADRYRGAGHRETADWHFVDLELDHPDLSGACFGFPEVSGPVSQGPADDCVVDKLEDFRVELKDPRTSPEERLLALKFVLHFMGDLHQPLHASDNHDKGGNCVRISLGGVRTSNLHAYWDTGVVQSLGPSAESIAKDLVSAITPQRKSAWEEGDLISWTMESYRVAKTQVYTLGSLPGCGSDSGPIQLPEGYEDAAKRVAAEQLEKAAVRLAFVLNHDLS